MSDIESIFTWIYKNKGWGQQWDSSSGKGSDLVHTKNIRSEFPKLLNELQIKSILDIPCGDFYWMKEIDLGSISYVGADIVDDIISHNYEHYSQGNNIFKKLDIRSSELPKVDLVLCRDLFQHFSFNDIKESLSNIKKSNSTFFLTTCHSLTTSHEDIETGKHRKINLTYPPFSLPKPMRVIDDSNLDNQEKRLFLWKINYSLNKSLI